MGILSTSPTFLVGSLEAIFGIIFFPSFFHLSVRLTNYVFRHRSLPPGDVLDICNKLVSAVFALLSVSVGLSVLRNCGDAVMTEVHPIVRHYIASSQGVKTSEEEKVVSSRLNLFSCLPSIIIHFKTGENSMPHWLKFFRARKIMIMHHLLIPFFGFPIFMSYRQSLGDCLIALGFCMEASTPFVSLRAILYHLGLKSSILYLVNGLLMNIVFFICRILLIFTGKVPLFCNSSMLLLFLPQLYWFSLMLRGSYKVITRILTPKEKV
ncbi:unnamed protein product [Lepeophtheirus salmonis]|uniref:(salmon louse) hypothetical protein n=1 Tax=Lepeophtheirus salmonis TaxID=72036 RepID=A0A7R8CFB8_LEPSM|nr:unnamed protein product [Lepeophtheirus salmonis]CAF2804911.1 unnamed protein product [Lepeophtheirus salmonis]